MLLPILGSERLGMMKGAFRSIQRFIGLHPPLAAASKCP
jgi:hypothetical protein